MFTLPNKFIFSFLLVSIAVQINATNNTYIKIQEDCILSNSPVLGDKYHFTVRGDDTKRVTFNPRYIEKSKNNALVEAAISELYVNSQKESGELLFSISEKSESNQNITKETENLQIGVIRLVGGKSANESIPDKDNSIIFNVEDDATLITQQKYKTVTEVLSDKFRLYCKPIEIADGTLYTCSCLSWPK
ncbi:hypothetical protein OAO18_05490 [Francisellaceae bacterium]|nr:hypothetical protein [Francisellaceae bacterium]